MKKSTFLLIISLCCFVFVSACNNSPKLPESQSVPTVIPTIAPTPKPEVNCSQEQVDEYLDELDYTLEEWDDTYSIAVTTPRASVAPIIGDLQDIKRNVRRIVKPDCAEYISGIVVVAMESDINALLSFLGNDSDSVVSRKMTGAKKAWEIVNGELDSFRLSPLDAYKAFNLSAEEIAMSLDKPEPFVLPEGWVDKNIPNSDLIVSIPDDWASLTYGDNDEYIKLINEDESIEILGGFFADDSLKEIESDSARLFSIQTYLETSDYDFYLEHSAEVEVHSLNKAYVVEYSVREYSGDDIEEKIITYVLTPDNETLLFFVNTSREEFAQIDFVQFAKVFGSIRK